LQVKKDNIYITITDARKETIVTQCYKFLLNVLEHVDVSKAFHATEACSSLDLTKVKYNIRKLVIEKEKVVAQIIPSNFKAC
jgi:hypothetical protein